MKVKENWRRYLPWIWPGFLLLILASFYLFPYHQRELLAYSEFKELLRQGLVDNLVISRDIIEGDLKPQAIAVLNQLRKNPVKKDVRTFRTIRLDDPDLLPLLEKKGIRYEARPEVTWLTSLLSWLIPLALFFVIWIYFLKRIGGGPPGGLTAIGKSKAKIYIENEIDITFADVAGVDEAVEELKEIIDFLKNPQKFTALGGKIPKGVLLVGPPGTGKTLLAKAVAGEARVPFLSLSGSSFVEMFVGVGAARVRDLFATAEAKAPCIIFIDEIDALGKARGVSPLAGVDEREQTLTQLLTEMDGFDTKKGVIIIAATNRPEILDPALLRPGRFDRHIVVDRPDLRGREAILKVHTRRVKLAPDVDLHVIAARTPGMVGADLANIVNEAALLAARRGKSAVTMEEFEEAIDRVIAGLEKKNRYITRKEKEIIAYHESGHALVAASVPHADPVHRVSIIPRGVAALGYTLQLPTEDRYLMTKSELLDRLTVLLGGRAAEELIFGEASTGAQNDLEKATAIARSMIMEYGMSDRLGPQSFRERQALFLPVITQESKHYSEATAREIDTEVQNIILHCYQRAQDILLKNRDRLEALAQHLLEKEILEGDDLKAFLGEKVGDF
ncbi:ATP-dependent metallopeptidase FtsH/Yme1/Tma family protein [Thermosulfuriphilus ammonigenes]|uniref:ATP-dependent zinc metalloprotease FtsH n=1 Tax=Thermosulfuriphilus ammonigenes TaxID=1936021 RepID=A0A6G7PX93_9BACT|nr:ATP-dependent zinc metalloprotease FtsH [Thermosulfuriphilus ammonigenes]MBA2847764.1 cell division protease FtsH [Thermosulfuriphilus ammonigenes]QIJ72033.1 ATP-dependent metallopeptidase FtsH/Yme1/Tma family protein [Thermosulfuriphilus ammonigenes]